MPSVVLQPEAFFVPDKLLRALTKILLITAAAPFCIYSLHSGLSFTVFRQASPVSTNCRQSFIQDNNFQEFMINNKD